MIASIEDIPGPSGDRFNSFALFVKKNGSDPRQVTSTFRTITQLWWTNSSKEVVFVAGNNGESGIFKVDIEEPKTQVIRGPKGEETFYQCTSDSKTTHLACTLETPDSPAEAAVISMHGGRLQVLTDANPEYNRLIRSAAKKYEWTNRYGDSAFGYLFLPVNYVKGTRYPLIITTYHAWGFMRGGVGDEYVSRRGQMDHAKLLGRRLKVLQKAKKLNQAQLAEKIGIETKYLSNLETGRRSPSFEKTVALAKATLEQLKQIYGHTRQVIES